MGWVTERGSVQSGEDSSGEEQLRSVISFSNMSDHLFANIIFAEFLQTLRSDESSFSSRRVLWREPNVGRSQPEKQPECEKQGLSVPLHSNATLARHIFLNWRLHKQQCRREIILWSHRAMHNGLIGWFGLRYQ